MNEKIKFHEEFFGNLSLNGKRLQDKLPLKESHDELPDNYNKEKEFNTLCEVVAVYDGGENRENGVRLNHGIDCN